MGHLDWLGQYTVLNLVSRCWVGDILASVECSQIGGWNGGLWGLIFGDRDDKD